jgi:hypothetical protein
MRDRFSIALVNPESGNAFKILPKLRPAVMQTIDHVSMRVLWWVSAKVGGSEGIPDVDAKLHRGRSPAAPHWRREAHRARTQRAAAYGKAVGSWRSLLVKLPARDLNATGSKTAIKPAASSPMSVAKCKITATQDPDVALLMRATGHNI